MFNYIITIHNKESLLPRVLNGIAACCSSTSKIIPVVDGCTDRSEAIVDDFAATSGLNVEKVVTPDVFELPAINAGLARVTEGFAMTIQDDVILDEPSLEEKVTALCGRLGDRVGVISPRHGANVRAVPFMRQLGQSGLIPLVDEFQRVTRPEEAPCEQNKVDYGKFAYRMVAGGSPMIIPETVWKTIGAMDPHMAPLMWFDHEYNIRALRKGFRNVVYPLRFVSDEDWGTMRVKARDAAWTAMVDEWTLRNRKHVWKKHGSFIREYLREHASSLNSGAQEL